MVEAAEGGPSGQAKRIAENYLSAKPPEGSCPMATLSVDASRSPLGSELRKTFVEGLERLAHVVAGNPPDPDRLVLLAAMVGAAVLRGGCNNNALGTDIKTAVVDFSQSVV